MCVNMYEVNLDTLDLIGAGKILKEERKKRNLTLEDLADENISGITISRAERGNRIAVENFIYLCSLLDINVEELPTIVATESKKEQEEYEDTQLQILSIENLISSTGSSREYLTQLDSLGLESDHPLYAYVLYLKGQYYLGRDNYAKAKMYFYDAIQLSEQSSRSRYLNIHPACFSELGRMAYLENDLEKALEFTNKGIETFDKNGIKKQTYYALHINKAIYLEHLDHRQEVSDILDFLWGEIENIRSIDTILHMYDVKAKVLRRSKLYRTAVEIATKGIYYARLNRKTTHLIELWTTLGEIYSTQKKFNNAEVCFLTAKSLESKVTARYVLFRLYRQLGLFYFNQGNLDEAQSYFEESLQRITKHSPILITRYVQTLKSLGDCLFEKGLYPDAVARYEEALELSDKYKLKKLKRGLEIKIGECLLVIDEDKFAKFVKKLFQKGVLKNE